MQKYLLLYSVVVGILGLYMNYTRNQKPTKKRVVYFYCMSHKNNNSIESITTFNPNLQAVLGEIEEGHYLFIIADRKKAFLYLFEKGDVDDSRNIMDPSVNKQIRVNSGEIYGKNSKLEHKIENQIDRHLKLVLTEAEKFINGRHVNGIFIGGHKELFHKIENELPQDLQKKLRGDFVTELNIKEEELISHCKKVLAEYLK